MIVVADTSPLNYLIQIEQVGVLQPLYDVVLIPHAVNDELIHPEAPAMVRAWAQNPPQWLEILSPSTIPASLQDNLDSGEAEAIALAEELHAAWLLIDETDGRDEAMRRGLQTIGTLGILRDAHRSGLLDFRVAVERLLTTGFYVNSDLIAQVTASL